MFAKLLKYEWKATNKIQCILALAVLGMGLLGGVILQLMINADYDTNTALAMLGVISMIVLFLSMVGCFIASSLLLLTRFYRNKFTDEGYLTFTLPVSGHQILWSSIVNILLWEVIMLVSLIVSICLLLLIGLAPEMAGTDWGHVWQQMTLMMGELSAVTGPGWLMLLYLPLSMVSGVVLMVTAITLGCSIAKKHKILASFGIYYGLNMVISTLSSVVSTSLVTVQMFSGKEPSLWLVYVFTMVLYAALGVGGYLLSAHLLHAKLNLS